MKHIKVFNKNKKLECILKLKTVYNYFYQNIKFSAFRKQLRIKIQNFLIKCILYNTACIHCKLYIILYYLNM